MSPEESKCPLCDSASSRLLEKDGSQLRRCVVCTFVYVPIHDEAAYIELYRDPGRYYKTRHMVGFPSSRARYKHDYSIASGRLEAIRYWKPTGRLLDVGCSNGAFLQKAREVGYEPVGIDLDPWIVSKARQWSDCPVLLGDIGAVATRLAPFDVVTMIDSLEHMVRPRDCMRTVAALVSARGLVYIEIPDADCVEFLSSPSNWKHTKPLEHVSYFGEKHVQSLAMPLGLQLVRKYTPIPMKAVYIFQATAARDGRNCHSNLANATSFSKGER